MPETHDLFEIMTTTRSMRRLKTDAISNELIRKILEAGVAALEVVYGDRWGGLPRSIAMAVDIPP